MLSAAILAADGGAAPSVESLLKELEAQGVDVIYSSDLVPANLRAPDNLTGSPRERAAAALAAHGLTLRELGPNRFGHVPTIIKYPGLAALVREKIRDPG